MEFIKIANKVINPMQVSIINYDKYEKDFVHEVVYYIEIKLVNGNLFEFEYEDEGKWKEKIEYIIGML